MTRETIQEMLEYWRTTLRKLMDAYLALAEGQVKSYEIDDRSLTRLDLPSLKKAINDAEGKVAQYENLLAGHKPRKAFAVVPRDW
jgi:hypothetical protein